MRRGFWLITGFALLVSGAVLATSLSSGAQAKGTIAKIKERRELRVGAGTYPPFVIRKPDGTYLGIDIDLTTKLAESLGVKVSYVPQGWDTIVVGLATGKFDLIPALAKNEERGKVIDFSEPYFELAGTYALLRDNPKKPKTLADLNRPEFAIVSGTGSWSEKVAKKYTPNATIKTIPGASREDYLMEILSGRADAWPTDTLAAALIKGQYGDRFTFIPDESTPIEPTAVAYGLPKGDQEWAAYVNKFIQDEKKGGTMVTLFKKWLVPEFIKPSY